MPSARIISGLMLMALAAGAHAECIAIGPPGNSRYSCNRDFSAQVEHESALQRSINALPWADANDWIRNPPQWVRDVKESRRLRAPVPLVHLWRSQQMQTLLALGVNRRGQPGLYIARRLPY